MGLARVGWVKSDSFRYNILPSMPVVFFFQLYQIVSNFDLFIITSISLVISSFSKSVDLHFVLGKGCLSLGLPGEKS